MKIVPSVIPCRCLVVMAILSLLVAPQAARAQVVASWESSLANLQAPRVSGHTVRQFARLSIGGVRFRVRISNEAS